MNKKEKQFLEIQKQIERWKNLSTDKILERLSRGSITPIGRKAYNEILRQRGIKK